jgi:hypothetical protein
MSTLRKLVLPIVLAISGLMATSGLVLAGTGSVFVPNVWGSTGVWGTYANFDAHYVATQRYSYPTQWWTITNLEMTALIQNGKTCEAVGYCTGWGYSAVATFYDWHGTKVLTVNVPNGSCYSHAWSTDSLFFTKCRYGSFTFAVNKPSVVTLTKMTLSWSVGVLVHGTFYFANVWHATRSLTLNPT